MGIEPRTNGARVQRAVVTPRDPDTDMCTFLLYYNYHYGGQGGHLNIF